MVNALNRTEEDISPKTSVHHHANTRASVKQGLCLILNVCVCACILCVLEARGGYQRMNALIPFDSLLLLSKSQIQRI